ncbi:MAG: hypothetical protein IPL97_09685 [Niastella sp.]|nr:hypothetical protein [Niastella sp.]
MKKIVLMLATLFIIAGVQAQSKSKVAKAKSEKMAKANLAKAEKERMAAEENEKTKMAAEQMETDRLAALQAEKDSLDSERMKEEARDRELFVKDSIVKVNQENERIAQEKMAVIKKGRSEIYTNAGLDEYQTKKVMDVNSTYFARANSIKQDGSLDAKAMDKKLKALNKERLKKIKDLVGRKKADALEKSRKELRTDNAEDTDVQWLYELDDAKGKK